MSMMSSFLLIKRTVLGVYPLSVNVMIFQMLLIIPKLGSPLPHHQLLSNLIRKYNLCKHSENVLLRSAISNCEAEILFSLLKNMKTYNFYLFNTAFIRL